MLLGRLRQQNPGTPIISENEEVDQTFDNDDTEEVVKHDALEQTMKITRNFPTFSAKRHEDVEFWIQQVSVYYEKDKIPDLHSFLLFTLKDQAASSLMTYLMQRKQQFIRNHEWNDFKLYLIKMFGRKLLPEAAFSNLTRLKMTPTDDVIDFNSKFLDLLRQTNIDDRNAIIIYLNALPPEYYLKMNS